MVDRAYHFLFFSYHLFRRYNVAVRDMTESSAPPQRLISLDVFRGMTIAGMVLVNNPGTWSAIYGPLKHAEWHGITPTDYVFPFFCSL
jgi:Uncharacterized conserved protein